MQLQASFNIYSGTVGNRRYDKYPNQAYQLNGKRGAVPKDQPFTSDLRVQIVFSSHLQIISRSSCFPEFYRSIVQYNTETLNVRNGSAVPKIVKSITLPNRSSILRSNGLNILHHEDTSTARFDQHASYQDPSSP